MGRPRSGDDRAARGELVRARIDDDAGAGARGVGQVTRRRSAAPMTRTRPTASRSARGRSASKASSAPGTASAAARSSARSTAAPSPSSRADDGVDDVDERAIERVARLPELLERADELARARDVAGGGRAHGGEQARAHVEAAARGRRQRQRLDELAHRIMTARAAAASTRPKRPRARARLFEARQPIERLGAATDDEQRARQPAADEEGAEEIARSA